MPNQATGQGNNHKKVSGSGFAVICKAEGSWSAPCFLSILGSKDKFTDTFDSEKSSSESSNDDDVKMIVIRKKELVSNLVLGNAVKFSVRKEERANVLVRDAAIIGVSEGRFQLARSDFFLAVKVIDVKNQGAYSLSTDHIEASDILTGETLLLLCIYIFTDCLLEDVPLENYLIFDFITFQIIV